MLHFRQTAAGFHCTGGKEQHQQGQTGCLQGSVNSLNDSPNGAALKVLRGYGQKIPHLTELPVPDGKGIVQKIYNNVFDKKSPPWAVRWNRPFSLATGYVKNFSHILSSESQ